MQIGLTLRAEIENTFNIVRERSTRLELCFVCPEPGCGDQSGNRSVNLQNGKTSCWRCGKGGNFLSWARSLGYRFANSDDVAIVGSLDTWDDDEKSRDKLYLPSVQAISLPKGFIPISDDPDAIRSRYIVDMARRKHLDYQDFVDAGVGFTREDPKWEPYAIFPVIEYGTTVYFQGRTYIDVPGESTKLFPSRSEVKYGSRYWIYGIDEVRSQKAEIVVAVESILNVLSLRRKFRELGWETIVPVCVFKHSVSTEQAIKLKRCKHVRELCLLFDHDATALAWSSSGKLPGGLGLTIAEMPEGVGNSKLDPNDDVEAAVTAIENRTIYTPANAFLRSTQKTTKSRLSGIRIPSSKRYELG